MLRIRPQQLKAFAAAADERLRSRLAAHLLRAWPAETAGRSKAEILAVVDRAIGLSRAWALPPARMADLIGELLLVFPAAFEAGEAEGWAAAIAASGAAEWEKRDRLLAEARRRLPQARFGTFAGEDRG